MKRRSILTPTAWSRIWLVTGLATVGVAIWACFGGHYLVTAMLCLLALWPAYESDKLRGRC